MSNPPGNHRICFVLELPAEEYLRYYQGQAGAVIVRAEDGRRVQLPASALRPFVTEQGIYGRFQLTLDPNNKMLDLRRL